MKLTMMLMVILAAGLVSPGSAGRRRRKSEIPEILRSLIKKTMTVSCSDQSGLLGSVTEFVLISLYMVKPHRELLCESECKLKFGKILGCRHQLKNVVKIRWKKGHQLEMQYVLEVTLGYFKSQYQVYVRRQRDGSPEEMKCTSAIS